MATLTVQEIVMGGLEPAWTAADVAGDVFANDGDTFLEVVNGSGGALTVTMTPQKACHGETVTPRAVSVPAGETRRFGRFDTTLFNNSSGQVAATYSGVGSLTVGAFKYG